MEPEIVNFLEEVLESISIIEENLQGIGFLDYRTNRKTMIAVVQNFETIFEILNKIPQNIKDSHPEIHWSEFENLRLDFQPDQYGINEEAVWNAAKHKLRKLKKFINESFFIPHSP